jgi:hypothetical protein
MADDRSEVGRDDASDSRVDDAFALRYYDLERYLFEDVHARFHSDGSLGAFDFFSIVIWKANRAKSRIARLLWSNRQEAESDLESIVRRLTTTLHRAAESRERLRILWDWGLSIPMASAVLAVLWPTEFSVYDYRVCMELGAHGRLGNTSSFDRLWDGYLAYIEAVRQCPPRNDTLRDKDRVLWARSSIRQLQQDLRRGFGVAGSPPT